MRNQQVAVLPMRVLRRGISHLEAPTEMHTQPGGAIEDARASGADVEIPQVGPAA